MYTHLSEAEFMSDCSHKRTPFSDRLNEMNGVIRSETRDHKPRYTATTSNIEKREVGMMTEPHRDRICEISTHERESPWTAEIVRFTPCGAQVNQLNESLLLDRGQRCDELI
jgi:hypothetical protein